jgi:vitamin B12 transporter
MRRDPGVVRAIAIAAALTASAESRLVAQFPAEIAGQVLDTETRKPLEGARVRVPVTGLVVETDAAGRFRLKGLPAGEWDIEVASIGYRAGGGHVTLTDGRVEQVTLSLEPKPVALAQIDVTAAGSPMGTGMSVIDREQIDRALAPDVPALLAGQPGVTITQKGGPGSPASVSIRGSSAHEVLVLLDGAPLNDPTTGDVDLAAIPLEQIERMTITRGAASARYGARALGGVIAIERRHSAETDGWLTLAAGAWGERTARAGGTAVREGGGRTIAGSLSGGLTRLDGNFGYEVPPIRGGGTADRANGDGRTNSLLGSIRLGGRHSLTEVRADYLDIARGLPGSFVQPTLDARQSEHRIGAGVSTRQSTGAVEWHADVDASSGTVRYADPAPPTGSPYDDSVRVRQLQATLEAGRSFGLARLSVGTEGRWLGVRASNLVQGAPASQQVLSAWLQASAEPTRRAAHPTLSAGLRVDRDDDRHDTHWSPSLGASVRVPGATLQLSWAMAFAPPTLADQFFQPGVLAQPNPALQPERVRNDWQLQLTSRTLRMGQVTANGSVSLFHADIDGMILWSPNFRFVWSPNNYDVRRRGAELSAAIDLPTANLSLTGSVSDAAVEYRGPVLSGQVAYRPRHTATSSIAASTLGFRGTLRYRYIGRRRAVAGSDLNTLAPFGVTDLQIARRIPVSHANVELAIALDDVFDRAGTMLLDYPSPGRTWRLTLSVRGHGASTASSSPTP